MLTTFSKHTVNYDITTKDWGPLNFTKARFNFPEPLISIEEHYDKALKKEAKGKVLAVWKINDWESFR